ncbi:hypothetical protein HPP92_015074 [Vanilla planifolia]|uniref:VLRF1 domain-containing protein n=1 Tax=Vanilla planifolia TaxID=51239 RepID=A0A835QSU8_VANPL|nr:hypothetical protein HPP92_015074 [Vanilla planifolia]
MAAAHVRRGELRFRSLFDLPSEFFDSCRLLVSHASINAAEEPFITQPGSDTAIPRTDVDAAGEELQPKVTEGTLTGTITRWTCRTCKSEFEALQDQRSHFKSDLHRLNIKLSVAGKSVVKEDDFDELDINGTFKDFDVSSLSGSEDETENGTFASGKADGIKKKLYLHLHSGETVSLWKTLIMSESEDVFLDDFVENRTCNDGSVSLVGEVEVINRLKYLLHEPRDKTHLRIVLLLSGGHFAGCVFDGNSIVAHKTFHRYIVRAKAGKRQSTKDATGKSAHSAGSSIRRYNESALKKEIQDLLASWQTYIRSSSTIFVYAPSRNRQILFDVEKQQFGFHSQVTRHIPLTVHRPTLKEAKRIYHSLTQLSYEVVEKGNPVKESVLHDGVEVKNNHSSHEVQLCGHLEDVTLCPCLSSGDEHLPSALESVSLSHCQSRSTPLHAAAMSGDAQWTLNLLEQGCNPCLKDERGQTPYMLATEKEVRNTFRRYMAANLDQWDWQAAHVPSPLTKEMEESQAVRQAEKDARRKAKAKELKKSRKAREKAKAQETTSQDVSTGVPHSSSMHIAPSKQPHVNFRVAPSKQQQKSVGEIAISKEEEERQSLVAEREKRAAAAERRIAAMKNHPRPGAAAPSGNPDAIAASFDLFCSCCNVPLAGRIPFHRYDYNYCSTSCMHAHKEILEDG